MAPTPARCLSGSKADSKLNNARRAVDLERLAGGAEVDVLVVGTGTCAAACALDAAARGLSVCLLTPDDLVAGHTRLPSAPLAANPAAVAELAGLLHTAPELVRGSPMLHPLYREVSARAATALSARLHATDAVRRGARIPMRTLPPPRRIPTLEALALAPGLRETGLRGALLSFEPLIPEPDRLMLAMCRTAAGLGAAIIPHAEPEALWSTGARVTDRLTRASCFLRARSVVRVTERPPSQEWRLVDWSTRAGVLDRHGSVFPISAHTAILGPNASTVDGLPELPPLARFSTPRRGPHGLRTVNGIVTVHGGQAETARLTGKAAIDATGITETPCATKGLRLRGTGTEQAAAALAELDPRLANGLPGTKYTAADVVLAVRNTGAACAGDVLEHRLGLTSEHSAALTEQVSELVARTLHGLRW